MFQRTLQQNRGWVCSVQLWRVGGSLHPLRNESSPPNELGQRRKRRWSLQSQHWGTTQGCPERPPDVSGHTSLGVKGAQCSRWPPQREIAKPWSLTSSVWFSNSRKHYSLETLNLSWHTDPSEDMAVHPYSDASPCTPNTAFHYRAFIDLLSSIPGHSRDQPQVRKLVLEDYPLVPALPSPQV